MDVLISKFHLQQLLQQAAEMGAIIALIKTGKMKRYLKKTEAFRLYGRKNVEQWIDERVIKPRKDGDHSAAWRIDRIELEIYIKSYDALMFF
jgi:hypothetical protein